MGKAKEDMPISPESFAELSSELGMLSYSELLDYIEINGIAMLINKDWNSDQLRSAILEQYQ